MSRPLCYANTKKKKEYGIYHFEALFLWCIVIMVNFFNYRYPFWTKKNLYLQYHICFCASRKNKAIWAYLLTFCQDSREMKIYLTNMTENFSLKALVMLSQSFLALLENLELLEILN